MSDVAVIACGALAVHVEQIAGRRGWEVDIHPLPPALHNRPEKIAPAVADLADRLSDRYRRVAVAYADCGTYGALDRVLAERGIRRLAGDHCYDVFGKQQVAEAAAAEPGTYFLTDFLARSFERTVWAGLGLDRHPELRDDYFRQLHAGCVAGTAALTRARARGRARRLPAWDCRWRYERWEIPGWNASSNRSSEGCMRKRAEVVVVGAGIVGSAVAHYLTRAGIRNVVVVDQGPLENTGGSSFHAPGLVFHANASRSLALLAMRSTDLYRSLHTPESPAWLEVGGIELATTPERLAECHRRQAYAAAVGVEASVLSPAEVVDRVPLVDPGAILGGLYISRDGLCKAGNVCHQLQRRRRVARRRDQRADRSGRLRHPRRPSARRRDLRRLDRHHHRDRLRRDLEQESAGA